MRLVVAGCEVTYTGRASPALGKGRASTTTRVSESCERVSDKMSLLW